MARSTSMYGLHENAQVYLLTNAIAKKRETCPTCGHESGGGFVERPSGEYVGMFEERTLREYLTDKDAWVKEIVQIEYWSSGPCIYLALADETGKIITETMWPEEEITYE